MRRAILLGTLLPFILACAHEKQTAQLARKGGDRPLFVGHTNGGMVVVAAKHADAMNGMAVLAQDIEGVDVEDGSILLCKREVITGSHYPQWICRYKDEQSKVDENDRNKARMFLQSLNQTCTDNCGTH
jgi:hypothetical protein